MRLLAILIYDAQEPNMDFRNALRNVSSYYEEHHWPDKKDTINEFIANRVNAENIDVLFMQIQNEGIIKKEMISSLPSNVKVFNFTGDVRQPLPQWYIDLAPYCTTLFNNLNDVQLLQSLGFKSEYFQIGFNNSIYRIDGETLSNGPQIVFMGNNYDTAFPLSGFRKEMVAALRSKYQSNFMLFGVNWEMGTPSLMGRQETEAVWYRSCKIAINLSHFDLKRYSSDRMYRLMACNTLCLSHKYQEIEEEFIDGVHLRTWTTLPELFALIDYYLLPQNEEERKRIAKAGHDLVIEKYTWDYRITKGLLSLIEDGASALILDKPAEKTPDFNWLKQFPHIDLRNKGFSQLGESNIIDYIFEKINTTNKFLVDIGAGGYAATISNTRHLLNDGWDGLLFDLVDSADKRIIKLFVTPFNIVQALNDNNCPQKFDLLNIDLDSFDFDIIDNILEYFQPRLICAEFNGTLRPETPVKLKYEAGYTWDSTNKYGFSFSAGQILFKRNNYTVVLNQADQNLFAIHNDELPVNLRNRIHIGATQQFYHPVNPNAIWENVIDTPRLLIEHIEELPKKHTSEITPIDWIQKMVNENNSFNITINSKGYWIVRVDAEEEISAGTLKSSLDAAIRECAEKAGTKL